MKNCDCVFILQILAWVVVAAQFVTFGWALAKDYRLVAFLLVYPGLIFGGFVMYAALHVPIYPEATPAAGGK